MWGEHRYTLIQHSPLLHFQLEKNGGIHWEGLRPTEVRSKLLSCINAFCNRHHIDIYYKEQKQTQELSEILKDKSNIKIKVYLEKPYSDRDVVRYQTSLVASKKFGCMTRNTTLIIQDFHQNITFQGDTLLAVMEKNSCTLLEMIDFVLPYFFRFTGFGYRSSKGYGCFSVSGRATHPNLEGYFLDTEMPFYYKIPRETNAQEKLNYIQHLYGRIVNEYKINYERKRPKTDLARSRIYLGMRYRIKQFEIASESVKRFSSPIQFRITPDEILLIPHPIPKEIQELKDLKMGTTTLKGSGFCLDQFLDEFWKSKDGKSYMAIKKDYRKEGVPCTT